MTRRNKQTNKQQRSFRRPRFQDVYIPKNRRVVEIVEQKAPKQKKQAQKRITPAGALLRKAGTVAGTFLGNASLGRNLGAGISRIFGQGDYQVQSNSFMRGGPPAFASMNTGIRIAHREYIGDVLGGINFRNVTYDVNPIDSNTFPWLSKIAANFEEYSFKGLVFYFNTTCGSAVSSTNNALGTVGMVTVYDPTDPALGSKRECEDYAGCVAGVPACSLLHPIECKPRANVLDRLYIQTQLLDNDEDKKFYSLGTLNLFAQGMQAQTTIGELWVSYDIEFHNPKIQPLGTYYQVAQKGYTVTTTQGTFQMMGTSSAFGIGNLGAYYDGSDGTFVLPLGTAPGYYMFHVYCNATAQVYGFQHGTLPGNLSEATVFANNTIAFLQAPADAVVAAAKSYWLCVYKTDTLEARLLIHNATAVPTGTLTFNWMIEKVPSVSVEGGNSPFLLTNKEEQLYAKLLQKLKQTGIWEGDGQDWDDCPSPRPPSAAPSAARPKKW